MRILVFGDSIVYGAWDSQGGWVERLKREFHQQYIDSQDYKNELHQVFNLGIDGNSSEELIARMEQEIKARQSANWQFVIIISIGTNDSRGVNARENMQVPLSVFKRNLEGLISIARQFTNKIVCVEQPPLADEVIQFKHYIYVRENIRTYNQALSDSAKAAGLKLVTVFDEFLKLNAAKLYAPDKLHPNDRGHELIASRVKFEL